MSLIDDVKKIASDQLTSELKTDLLSLLETKLTQIEKECADLQTKCTNLVKENSELRKKLAKISTPPEFTEYRGALFKIDASGSYTPVAYCPECKRAMYTTNSRVFPYTCSASGCGYKVTIHDDLQTIFAHLNKES